MEPNLSASAFKTGQRSCHIFEKRFLSNCWWIILYNCIIYDRMIYELNSIWLNNDINYIIFKNVVEVIYKYEIRYQKWHKN